MSGRSPGAHGQELERFFSHDDLPLQVISQYVVHFFFFLYCACLAQLRIVILIICIKQTVFEKN